MSLTSYQTAPPRNRKSIACSLYGFWDGVQPKKWWKVGVRGIGTLQDASCKQLTNNHWLRGT